MMRIIVTVASGLEAALKRELSSLGYGSPPVLRGRGEISGGFSDIARLNTLLRTGERVLLGVGEFPARSFDELFENVRALPWEEYLTPHARIRIDGKSFKSALVAVKAAGGVVKKAILERLGEKYGVRSFDEKGERAVVGVSLFEDVASVTLDTSGDGLHRRGYRTLVYDAPLRETTAAAIIASSFYRADRAFADPFCGSGTLPVEAVLYARRIAPGKARSFDFTAWKCTPAGVLERAREEALAGEYRGEIAPVFASDLSPRAVRIAARHAERAGVAKDIRFSVADVAAFTASERYGVVASNPPYGERIGSDADLFRLYRTFGTVYRALPDWSCYFLSAYRGAERAFGHVDRRRPLTNANIPCTLYSVFGGKPPRGGGDPP